MKFKEIKYTLLNYELNSIIKNILSLLISDAHVISYRKSGRTWLRLMLAKVISKKYNLKIGLDTQFMTLFTKAPNLVFSHAGCTKNNNIINFKRVLKNKKIIFLVRDPKDDIVSLYNDYTYRDKKCDMSPSKFIRDERYGIENIINYLNLWMEEMRKRPKFFLLIKYEDIKKNPAFELKKVLNFLNINCSEDIINQAVEFASFKNMRKMELSNKFRDARMQVREVGNVNTYKTRKGKVGSYKEELIKEDIDYLKSKIRDNLNSKFNY